MASEQDTTPEGQKKARRRWLAARGSVKRIPGETDMEFSRRRARELYRVRVENPEYRNYCAEKSRRYAKDHPDRIAATKAASVAKKPEKYAAAQRAHYEKNKDKIKARSAKWQHANREHVNARLREAYAKDKSRFKARSARYLAKKKAMEPPKERRKKAPKVPKRTQFPWSHIKVVVDRLPGEAPNDWRRRYCRVRYQRLMEECPEFRAHCVERANLQFRRRRAVAKGGGGTHTKQDVTDIRKSQKDKCALCGVKLRGGGHLDHIQPLARGGTNYRRNLQWLCDPCNRRKAAKDPLDFARERGLLL